MNFIREQNEEFVHCVALTTVSFQKHAARSKTDRFLKKFHWMITIALIFVSKLQKIVNLKDFIWFHCI